MPAFVQMNLNLNEKSAKPIVSNFIYKFGDTFYYMERPLSLKIYAFESLKKCEKEKEEENYKTREFKKKNVLEQKSISWLKK